MKETILYFEDNPNLGDLVKMVLNDEGYNVIHKLIPNTIKESEPIDLILTDGFMGRYTFLDSIKYQKKHYPETPLVVYSGDLINYREARDLGYTALMKGGNMEDLIYVVKKELGDKND